MIIPVISLYGPWANWVSLGWKTIETRLHDRFRCLVGQRIGIHVALKWDKHALHEAMPYLTSEQINTSREFLTVGGAIICTAYVWGADWLTDKDSPRAMIDCGSTRRFGIFLREVEVIPTFCCTGRQGIWYQDVPIVGKKG